MRYATANDGAWDVETVDKRSHVPATRVNDMETISRSSKVPREVFAGWFPGAGDVAAMLAYFEAHTYLGSDSRDAIALANRGRRPADDEVCGMGQGELRDPRRHLKTPFSGEELPCTVHAPNLSTALEI